MSVERVATRGMGGRSVKLVGERSAHVGGRKESVVSSRWGEEGELIGGCNNEMCCWNSEDELHVIYFVLCHCDKDV